MPNANPTIFAEANALLHMQDGDPEDAKASVRGMLSGEIRRLRDASDQLAQLCREELDYRRYSGDPDV